MVNLTAGLNEEQASAVTSDSDEILMRAGAGTGKTRTLTHRIAHLNLNHRVGASSIVAITFTRAAAKEMKDRLVPLIGEQESKRITCCTFHALAVRILQEWGHRLNLDRQFTIYSQEDREEVMKVIIETMGYRTSVSKVIKAVDLRIKGLEEQAVWDEYNYQLRRYNAVDLDALISKVNTLFSNHPDVAEYYRKQWKYLFVDEFQDTDQQQMEFIRLLNPEHLFCIGDWRQSIYGWRGARVRNILEFTSSYPNTEVIELNRNYRSTVSIVEAANNLISHSGVEIGGGLVAYKEGTSVDVVSLFDDDTEMDYVIIQIKERVQSAEYSNFAILARTNAQIDNFYQALRRENIPCTVLSASDDPLKKPDVKSLLNYLAWIYNPQDETNFKRVIKFPERSLTDMQLQIAEQIAIDKSIPLWEALVDSNEEMVVQYATILQGIAESVRECVSAYDALDVLSRRLKLRERYIERYLNNRLEDLDQAQTYIMYWVERQLKSGEDHSPTAFLKWIKIRDIQEKLMEDRDAVKLMTVHGSKGLEFPIVFLVGMNEGLFPSQNTRDIEEERRLAYVAVTRAENELIITTTKSHSSWGKVIPSEPSRFIDEMKFLN
ncbi:UvrD-helicase domain-containing protein [Paenibacillus sp. FSL R10-2796]|uniref:ATP-dependent helicase n=1 Tax=Paenibacillus sp. FSL R10-2796 TaxID=2954663 RepID=UPI0030D8C7E7